jgi:probable HAF family extracellular repeat protein
MGTSSGTSSGKSVGTLSKRALAVLVAASFAGWSGAAQAAYTFIDLGYADGGNSYGPAINTTGEVVTSQGGQSVYTYGGPNSFQQVGGANAPDNSVAYGLNDGGVVVGQQFNPNASAFYTTTNPISSTTPIYSLPGQFAGGAGAVATTANAVNGSATNFTIVGQAIYTGPNAYARAFIWNNASNSLTPIDPVTPLGGPTTTALGGPINGSSEANGINAIGLVVGTDSVAGGATHAFVYTPAFGPAVSHVYDLGTFNGSGNSTATAINLTGETVGYSDLSSGDTHAFYTTGAPGAAQLNDIGVLSDGGDSYALGVNDTGMVVGVATEPGYSPVDGSQLTHAFIFNSGLPGGTISDLNDDVNLPAGYTLDTATGINALGDITGIGDDGSNYFAYVLAPVPVAVPEPTLATLLAGLAGAATLRRRRR